VTEVLTEHVQGPGFDPQHYQNKTKPNKNKTKKEEKR
jgi:hypothetical protein